MPERRSSPRRPPDRSRPPRRDPTTLARGDFSAGDLGLGVRLVHEDDDLLIVDKPTGLVSAPVESEPNADDAARPSVFGVVKRYVRSRQRRGGRAWIIHRLDKEASGLLVFAKTDKAFQWLKEDFRARRVHRLYLAVVEGVYPPTAASGTIQTFVSEDDRGLMRSVPGAAPRARSGPRRADSDASPGPQLAVTHYRVVASGMGRSLVQLRLGTGRKNQIRVHLSESGHPLVGDYRYRAPGESAGASVQDPLRRLCLHAVELGFTHPDSGASLRFTSPAPDGFWSIVGERPRGVEERESAQNIGAAPSQAAATPPAPRRNPTDGQEAPPTTSWDHVAGWYEQLLGDGRSDHHRDVILPGAMRLLHASRGQRVLDIACGQGVLCRRLEQFGVEAVGIDASTRLIDAARRSKRSPDAPAPSPETPQARFEVGDARALAELGPAMNLGAFDAAVCVMALMNIDPLEPIIRGASALLKPGGALVAVILHPAFRAPGQTSWGWDKTGRQAPGPPGRMIDRRPRAHDDRPAPIKTRQYRRVDGYLSTGQTPIVMNPGSAAHGAEAVTTWTFHRPIQTYVRTLAEGGFLIESLEEWPSLRQSQPGPNAREENRARREIPMFLGLRAVKRG